MGSELAIRPESAVATVEGEESKLLALWLHGRGPHTARAYRRAWSEFRSFITAPIHSVTLADCQDFVDALQKRGLALSSIHSAIAGVKSFFGFCCKIGFLRFNVAGAIRLPAARESLNERILSEQQVQAILTAAASKRDWLILATLYATGFRVDELANLRRCDAVAREQGGQLTVLGKGRKTRTVPLPEPMWTSLLSVCPSEPDGLIFAISLSQIRRVLTATAKRAGVNLPVSPHFFRHSHCSHALDHGCPLHVIQATAGHSNIATTSRYLHARPRESSSAFLKFGSAYPST